MNEISINIIGSIIAAILSAIILAIYQKYAILLSKEYRDERKRILDNFRMCSRWKNKNDECHIEVLNISYLTERIINDLEKCNILERYSFNSCYFYKNNLGNFPRKPSIYFRNNPNLK